MKFCRSVWVGWLGLLGHFYAVAFIHWRIEPSTRWCQHDNSWVYKKQSEISLAPSSVNNSVNRTWSQNYGKRQGRNGDYSNKRPPFENARRKRRGRLDTGFNTKRINRVKTWHAIDKMRSSKEIDKWMRQLEGSYFSNWTVPDQIALVKLLQERRAFKGILFFLDALNITNVKVCTTAMFSMALSSNHRHEALGILDLMDRRGTSPTSLTFIALLGSIDGPAAVAWLMNRFKRYQDVKLTAEVYNSAIYACRRVPAGSQPDDNDWQVALRLLQQMRSKRIQPTTKTFHAVLQVLSRTGKVSLAMSLLEQMKSTPHLETDDSVWAASINVCAQASDYVGAIRIINEMQNDGFKPNLRHCSALIKAFARSKQDQLALSALAMMTGEVDQRQNGNLTFRLPQIAPDLIALNTVMAACAKSNNLDAALAIYTRMKAGEFVDPCSNKAISPDLISHHSILSACNNPEDATHIVKEMRLSRRYRYGSVPPTNVTYVHAINVCQKANEPDLEGVEKFLQWADADGIQTNVFMYASAIWTAQRCGKWRKALEYYDKMEHSGIEANDVAYNGLLSAICSSGDVFMAMEFCQGPKRSGHRLFSPTLKRLVNLISSVESVPDRQEFLESLLSVLSVQERTVSVGGPVFEALINVYGLQGRFEEALATFESIEGLVDNLCLRSILSACSLSHPARWEDAVSILHTSDIVEGTAGPFKIDQIALGHAILACCKADQFEEGLNLLQLYGVSKGASVEGTPAIPVVAMNALIAACGRGRRPDLSLATFNDMQSKFDVKPDVRSYRSAVIACNQAEHEIRVRKTKLQEHPENDDAKNTVRWWECALALLRRMREEGLMPDVKIFSSVISACEAAGAWQRALGVLQTILDDYDSETEGVPLNLYCFNAAISACEKGGAWVEALELYERMSDRGGSIKPNPVTLGSLIVALENAGQKELAQSKYVEGRELGIVNPWRWTRDNEGSPILALDLHRFSAAMTKVALRCTLDSFLAKESKKFAGQNLVIITGRGRGSVSEPILKSTTLDLLYDEYQLVGRADPTNPGRVVVDAGTLSKFVHSQSWV